MTEPATSMDMLISSTRRLPYMSPSRPITGVAAALASSVAVTAQAASAADAPSSVGSSGTSGITSVCISDTAIPLKASTTTNVDARDGPAAWAARADGLVMRGASGGTAARGNRFNSSA
ncbi:hypothetical protein GCM10020001_096100 [Nonomuraea salmonea]